MLILNRNDKKFIVLQHRKNKRDIRVISVVKNKLPNSDRKRKNLLDRTSSGYRAIKAFKIQGAAKQFTKEIKNGQKYEEIEPEETEEDEGQRGERSAQEGNPQEGESENQDGESQSEGGNPNGKKNFGTPRHGRSSGQAGEGVGKKGEDGQAASGSKGEKDGFGKRLSGPKPEYKDMGSSAEERSIIPGVIRGMNWSYKDLHIPHITSDCYEASTFMEKLTNGDKRFFVRDVYTHGDYAFSPEQLVWVKKTNELLTRIASKYSNYRKCETMLSDINTEELITALEIEDNPIPALEWPHPKQRARIVITPDVSGSCAYWGNISATWARQLSKLMGGGVMILDNYDGRFNWGLRKNGLMVLKDYRQRYNMGTLKRLSSNAVGRPVPPNVSALELDEDGMYTFIKKLDYDVMIYLGDAHGFQSVMDYGIRKRVIALCVHGYMPDIGQGCQIINNGQIVYKNNMVWVNGIDYTDPHTWHTGIMAAAKLLRLLE